MEFILWHWRTKVQNGQKKGIYCNEKPVCVLLVDEVQKFIDRNSGFACRNYEIDKNYKISEQILNQMKSVSNVKFLCCPIFDSYDPDGLTKIRCDDRGNAIELKLLTPNQIINIAKNAKIDIENRYIKNLVLSTRGNPRIKNSILFYFK